MEKDYIKCKDDVDRPKLCFYKTNITAFHLKEISPELLTVTNLMFFSFLIPSIWRAKWRHKTLPVIELMRHICLSCVIPFA